MLYECMYLMGIVEDIGKPDMLQSMGLQRVLVTQQLNNIVFKKKLRWTGAEVAR